MFSATRATTVVSQPREVLDVARVRAAESQPRVLNRVVGLAQRAEHPVRDRPQVRALLLELLGQPVVLIHRSSPLRFRVLPELTRVTRAM